MRFIVYLKTSIKTLFAKSPLLDYLSKVIYVTFSRAIYFQKYKKASVVSNSFLFECFRGKMVNDSPLAIYEALLKQDNNNTYTWVLSSSSHPLYSTLQEHSQTNVVLYGSTNYYLAYATHQYWIVNCRIPFCIIKKVGQVFTQCWHGTPLKRIGLDIKGDNNALASQKGTRYLYQIESKMIDYFISPSQYASSCFISSFALRPSQVLELGYPRNDQLVKYRDNFHYINAIKKKLNIAIGIKVILYAPTFRDNIFCNKSNSHILTNPLDSKVFLDCFDERIIFLYRGHYFTSRDKEDSQFIDVSDYDNVNDLLLISDLLITDYSSLFFDYSILNKPSLFFMYDRDTYENETRGFYLNINQQLPGAISSLPSTLANDILHAFNRTSDMSKFNTLYNPHEDGLSADRVINTVVDSGKLTL